MRTLLPVLAAFLCACSAGPNVPPEGRTLPPDLNQSRVLDIQVQRAGTRLVLTNTTTEPLPAGTFWINGRYSAPVGPLGVGQSLTLDLRRFRDQFGERFRAGGFFAAQEPEPVVLAQWEIPRPDGSSELVGLIAIAERN
jgi:hypothetical protein